MVAGIAADGAGMRSKAQDMPGGKKAGGLAVISGRMARFVMGLRVGLRRHPTAAEMRAGMPQASDRRRNPG